MEGKIEKPEETPEESPFPEIVFDQADLIPFVNPLRERFTREFMRTIPKTPGVYTFYGEGRRLLYVGKAKELRTRLLSYRRAKPANSSRKILRLVHEIRSVEWEECADERGALLLENSRLRTLVPPYNDANTKPRSYHYLGLRVIALPSGTEIRLRLTGKRVRRGERLFGAFKGRGRLQVAYGALLRALWTAAAGRGVDFPRRLSTLRLPHELRFEVGPGWAELVSAFLAGESPAFLDAWESAIAALGEVSPFHAAWVARDRETLTSFYERSLARVRAMAIAQGLRRRWIEQDEVDDFIVDARFRKE
jgi:hypothetical protein